MIYRILLVCLAFISCSSWGFAQDAKSFEIKADSSRIEAARFDCAVGDAGG